MDEKTYKKLKNGGTLNLVFGIVTVIFGIASGVMLIISGARLLSHKPENLF